MPGVSVYMGAHTWTLCVCLRKYAAWIQHALKINRRVNKQDRERESVHVLLCVGEEERLWGKKKRKKEKKSAFPSVFLSAAGTELSDFSVNHPLCVSRRGHNTHPGFGLEELRPRKETRPRGSCPWESRIWRSLKTSLLNSTPTNGERMWRNEAESKSK